nr:M28 family peptidase [Pseudomarimonas arenosa]
MATILLVFVGLSLVGRYSSQPPAPLPADAPADQFSAGRAFAHVERIAQTPHAGGSPENAAVRAYLVETLQALGLEVEVQRQVVTYQYSRHPSAASVATVHNVLARLPGQRRDGKQLILMSHHDTRESTPGAGDASSGVATLLETARALSSGERPRNDVLFLFTDGEETGLFGAQAYFGHHPSAARTGLVLNFDARGSRGPVWMFQTSEPSAPLIEILQDEVSHPLANSLSLAAYKQIPNDTDLSIALEAGFAGMNFAFIDGFFDYHQATDTPQRLSLSTLQHLGDYALPLARRLANEQQLGDVDLGKSPAQRSFFFLPGIGLVDYPAWIDLLAGGLVALLLGLAVARLKWESRLSWLDLLRGWVTALLTLALPLLLIIHLQNNWLGSENLRASLAQLARSEALWWIFALLTLGLAIWLQAAAHRGKAILPIALMALLLLITQLHNGDIHWLPAIGATTVLLIAALVLSKPLSSVALVAGAALLWPLLIGLLAFAMPQGLFLVTWPMCLPAIWWVVAGRDAQARRALVLVSALIVIPAGLILIPFAQSLFVMLALMSAAIAMLLLLMTLLTALPALFCRDLRAPAAVLSLCAVTGFAWAALSSPFDQQHPAPASVFTVQVDGKSFRISDDALLSDWHRDILGDAPTTLNSERYAPGSQREVFARELALPSLEGASIELRATASGGRLELKAPSDVRQMNLYVPRNAFTSWRIDGKALPPPSDQSRSWPVLRVYAPPQEGVLIEFELDAEAVNETTELVLTSVYPKAIGDLALPARPPELMPHPYTHADGVLVVQRIALTQAQPSAVSHGGFEQPTTD